MNCSVEISMYPLHQQYVDPIIDFIKELRSYPDLEVETNGMSTQVFGDYEIVMGALNSEMKEVFLNNKKVVFNLKVINSHLQEKPQF